MKIISFKASDTYNNQSKWTLPKLNAVNTGYVAMGAMGLTMATGMARNKAIRNSHKYFSLLTVAASVLHIIKVFNHKK